jgi:hypothetical protein
MNFQVPLLVIDRRGVSIIFAQSRIHRITHLMFDITRVVVGY